MKSNRNADVSGSNAFLVGVGLGISAMALLGFVKLVKMVLTPNVRRENLEAEIHVLGHAGAGA